MNDQARVIRRAFNILSRNISRSLPSEEETKRAQLQAGKAVFAALRLRDRVANDPKLKTLHKRYVRREVR